MDQLLRLGADDPIVGRAILRAVNLLATPQQLMNEPEVMTRIDGTGGGRRRGRSSPQSLGPGGAHPPGDDRTDGGLRTPTWASGGLSPWGRRALTCGSANSPGRKMDLLAMYAASQPDKAAVIDDRPGQPVVSWSFAELDRRANQLGHHLVALGVEPGTKVVWCGQNSAALLAGSHAIRKVGAVGVPLNYRLTPEEAAYVIDNCDAKVVYVDAEYAPLISQVRDQIPKVDRRAGLRRRRRPGASAGTAARDPAARGRDRRRAAASSMIYTSGTTGKPKGAVRRANLDPASGAGLIGLIGYVPDDVYLTTGPLYHSGPGGFAAIAHALGNTVVVQHKFDPEDWLRLVQTYGVTTTFTAPTPIRMVCTLPASVKDRYDRSSMKRFIANAAPWTMALKKMYLADFPPESLWEVYGSTELGVDTVLRPEDHLRKPGSCGQAAPGIEIKLFDEHGHGGHRAVRARRAVRAVGGRVRHLLQGRRRSTTRPPAGTSTPSATSPTATRRATTTSPTARTT